MNTAAVSAWEQIRLSSLKSSSNKPRRQRRRRRQLGATRDCTSSDTAVGLQRPLPQQLSKKPPSKRSSSVSPKDSKNTGRALKQSSPRCNRPDITVQVSQHSNFDRDLYVAYQSSLSTQGTSSLPIPYPISRLNNSSICLTIDSPLDSQGIIPDSQSLPGSSSYIPTSSTSLAVLGADQAPLIKKSLVLKNNTDLESSIGVPAEVYDSIGGSSVVIVGASQPSAITSERSRSEPISNTAESSASPSGRRLPLPPRSISDPSSKYNRQYRDQVLVSEHPKYQQPQETSEVQVPGSTERSSYRYHNLDGSPARSLNFLTQVPLAFASQGSRVSIVSGTFGSESSYST